jgi:hypothetical protein
MGGVTGGSREEQRIERREEHRIERREEHRIEWGAASGVTNRVRRIASGGNQKRRRSSRR